MDLILEMRGLPTRERFMLGDHLAKTAISVPSNIAEGAGRNSPREFRRFLGIALGSAYELETQVLIARDVGVIGRTSAEDHLRRIGEIQRMLHGLRGSIRL